MKEKIEAILREEIPNAFFEVKESKLVGLVIHIAASSNLINGVPGQYSAHVSLRLTGMELDTQIFGGSGGNRILRLPNKEDEGERFLAYGSEKIPFRRPKKTEEAVLQAIRKFAGNWREIVRKLAGEGKMPHTNFANYERATSKEFLDF